MDRFIIMPKWDASLVGAHAPAWANDRAATLVYAVSERRSVVDLSAKDLKTVLADHGISEDKPLSSHDTVVRKLGPQTAASLVAAAGVDPSRGAASLLGATTVVLASQAAADALAQDLPGYEVIKDFTIELVAPIQSTAAMPAEATDEWKWFHEQVDAHVAAAQGLTGADVGVAVLDTGIDSSHTEVKARVVRGVSFDVTARKHFETETSVDTDKHGTHVAGIIAGKEVGIAPGARLYSVTMIPKGKGWYSEFILAIEWAAANPDIRIVNMSAGLRNYHASMLRAVTQLKGVGVLPVVAIGNEGRNRTRSPGNYDIVLSVGATDQRRRVASFSGGGIMRPDVQQYTVPDVVAPGDVIRSCVPGGGYEYLSGTSMATPVVSGVAALLLERYPNATQSELESALIDTAVSLDLPESRQGTGLVSFTKADAYL